MTDISRLFLGLAPQGAPGRSVPALVFLLALALVHPPSLLCAPALGEGLGPDRLIAAQAASPMDRETAPEKRLEDSGPPSSEPAAGGLYDPRRRGAFLLKHAPLSQDMAIRAREVFNRLLVRILSPLSRRSWG